MKDKIIQHIKRLTKVLVVLILADVVLNIIVEGNAFFSEKLWVVIIIMIIMEILYIYFDCCDEKKD